MTIAIVKVASRLQLATIFELLAEREMSITVGKVVRDANKWGFCAVFRPN